MHRPVKRRKQSFGERVRRTREKSGMGLRELARRTEMHPTYLSKIELGQVPPPHWEKQFRLAEVLGSDTLMVAAIDALHDEIEGSLRQLESLAERLPHLIQQLHPLIRARIVELANKLIATVEADKR